MISKSDVWNVDRLKWKEQGLLTGFVKKKNSCEEGKFKNFTTGVSQFWIGTIFVGRGRASQYAITWHDDTLIE